MAKQNQQQPKQNEHQSNSGRGNNPEQQGGRNAQGQTESTQQSQGQPGARQSDQGGARSSGSRNEPKGSQRGQTPDQQGSRSTDNDDESPEMNEADEQLTQSGERQRQGAPDAQYGTDSSSKASQQTNRPQGSQSPTGSDRDTMGGSRSKGL